jgi:hypothetical protein
MSGPALFVLTLAWLGGTVGLFAAAVKRTFCFMDCQISDHDSLVADRLILGSVACAVLLPLTAAVICMCTERMAGSLLFLTLGVLPGIAYGMTGGVAVVREMHRLEPADPPSLPSNYCPCYSGGGCDCPGG